MPESGNLINGDTLHGSFTLNKRTGTLITLETEGKSVEKTIELTVGAPLATPMFTGGEITNDSSFSLTNVSTSASSGGVASGAYVNFALEVMTSPVSYRDSVDGWVTKSSGDVVMNGRYASDDLHVPVNGLTLQSGKAFRLTVPNGGSSTLTFNFSVDSSGNVTIT